MISGFSCWQVKGHTLELCMRRREGLGTRLDHYVHMHYRDCPLRNQRCIATIYSFVHQKCPYTEVIKRVSLSEVPLYIFIAQLVEHLSTSTCSVSKPQIKQEMLISHHKMEIHKIVCTNVYTNMYGCITCSLHYSMLQEVAFTLGTVTVRVVECVGDNVDLSRELKYCVPGSCKCYLGRGQNRSCDTHITTPPDSNSSQCSQTYDL